MADVIAVVHRVAHPAEAAEFFARVLGMTRVGTDDDDPRLANGALEVRLVAADGGGVPELELELSTDDATACVETLLQEPDTRLLPDVARTRADRIERRVAIRHGVVVRAVQLLDEDRLGVLPPLPAALEWEPDATRLVQETLRTVPLSFRDLARSRMTERAEFLACRAGAVVVDVATAVRGMLEATPAFQQPTLRATLAAAGALPLVEPA